jgi:hypothetical protein
LKPCSIAPSFYWSAFRREEGQPISERLRLEPRTVVHCSNTTTSVQPLYSTTSFTHSTLRHNAFHYRSPCCVRQNRSLTRIAAPALRLRPRLRRTGAYQLTRRTACPTSRVSTARTTFPPGRSFTRPTTVSGSGRRWVDNRARVERAEQRGEERKSRRAAKRMNAAKSARKNGMLICDSQGPNAKYMLYPYYATLIATSFCTFTSVDSDTAELALTTRQPPCT